MTITYDPHHQAYRDEADVRGELTRVFDVCQGCRICAAACASFPSLFEMLDAIPGHDAGSLTPVQQDRVVDECYQCWQCRSVCPYLPGTHALAIDFPRLMARARAMRRATGQGSVRGAVADHLFGHADRYGKAAVRVAPLANRIVGAAPGGFGRRILARLTGISARRRMPAFAGRRFSPDARRRQRQHPPGGVDVALVPTCLVEYLRPQLGQALVDVYARNGITCVTARLGCCGAPWLTAGDTRRFAAAAADNVAVLAAAVRAGIDVVVAQPTCHAVITTAYPDHLQEADTALVASHTFDAVGFLADRGTTGERLAGRSAGPGPARVVHHEPLPGDSCATADLLAAAAVTVSVVRRATGIDGRWGLRAGNDRIAIATARSLAAQIELADAEIITGSCVLANTAIIEQTGREVLHPLELLAVAYGGSAP